MRFQRIAKVKLNGTALWRKRKWKDIKLAKKAATDFIEKLPAMWSVEKLKEQWATQQEVQLSAKSCMYILFVCYPAMSLFLGKT
jgi:hypothetical protein